MASDLIYREDAKDFVRHAYYKGLNPIEYLDEVPAADVRPVVRGKWEPAGGSVFPMYACSLCRAISLGGNFCPNCGADMRPDKNDQSKEGG